MNWAAILAEHDRWLRTIVLARLGERQAVLPKTRLSDAR